MIIDMLDDPNEMMILGRPFLSTIHVRINVFDKEISLGVGEDKIVFDMNGNVHHPVVVVKNVCMINDVQGEESFNPLEIVLNEWVLDCFGEEYETNEDPFSRSLEDYKLTFDIKIKELQDEYELGIGKKGYVLDDIWEKYEQVHGGTMYSWHDEGFEEEELWESGLDKKYYDPPQVCVKTFEVNRYTFENEQKFICVTNVLDEDLPLGRLNGSRFKGMIQKEMDT
ncbi:hypothetical protein Tco_1201775 [Tanacetum coccineum]